MAAKGTLTWSARGPAWLATVAETLRFYPYTVLVLAVTVAMAAPFMLSVGDWEGCFHDEARRLWAGDTLYSEIYPYPPFPALLAVPFAFMPYSLSEFLFYALNMACFVGMIRWSWQLSGGGRLEGRALVARREHLILLLGLCLGAKLAWNCLSHHQSDLIIGAAVLGGCLALARARTYLAAAAFGLAAAMKGPALLFAPYLVWRGRWKEAAWLCAVFVGLNLLPTILVPAQHNRFLFGEWIQRFLKPMGESKQYPFFWYTESNQSLIGIGYRWSMTTWAWTDKFEQRLPHANPLSAAELRGLLLAVAAGLVLATMLVQGWRRASSGEAGETSPLRHALECSMVLLLMLLFSPMSSKPHFGTLMLPGFCLARLMIEKRSFVLGGLVSAALVAVLLSQNFMGDRTVCIAMWYGTLSWACVLLWLGCAYGLRVCLEPRPVAYKCGQEV